MGVILGAVVPTNCNDKKRAVSRYIRPVAIELTREIERKNENGIRSRDFVPVTLNSIQKKNQLRAFSNSACSLLEGTGVGRTKGETSKNSKYLRDTVRN